MSALRFWNPLLRRLLERDPGDIERRARNFRITTSDGRRLVAKLGRAFLDGYNAMLRLPSAADVAAVGEVVDPHYRPFFFEGAAMGYLPRGYLSPEFQPENAERDLLAMQPGYRYLYYVGLGFWLALRHPGHPESIEKLAPHLDPMYAPLCYDGYGFKVGFFDYPADPDKARRQLERCPEKHRASVEQGFGRSLFFVFMNDEKEFRAERDRGGTAHAMNRELGRSLAVAFTGADRPREIEAYIESAGDESERAARLTGVTWALAARKMNDEEYFTRCMARASEKMRPLFLELPGLCDQALAESSDYAGWQTRTRDAAVRAYLSRQPVDDVRDARA